MSRFPFSQSTVPRLLCGVIVVLMVAACRGGQVQEKKEPRPDHVHEDKSRAEEVASRKRQEEEERAKARARELARAQAEAEAQTKRERDRAESEKRRIQEAERERAAAIERKKREAEKAQSDVREARETARKEADTFEKERRRYLDERERRRKVAESNDTERASFWRRESQTKFGRELIIRVPKGRVCAFAESPDPLQFHGLSKVGIKGDVKNPFYPDYGNATEALSDRKGNWIPLLLKTSDDDRLSSRKPDMQKAVAVKIKADKQTFAVINVHSDGDGIIRIEAESDDDKATYYVWSVEKITLTAEER